MHDRVSDYLDQWRAVRPGLDLAPMSVTGRVSRAADLLAHSMRGFFAEHDVQPGEYDVLSALRRAGEPYTLTAGALTDSMMVTAGAMTNRLSRLEEKGLVERATDPGNRRSVLVSLTGAGRDAIEELVVAHTAAEGELLGALDRADLDRLADLLELLLAGLGDRSRARGDRTGDDEDPDRAGD